MRCPLSSTMSIPMEILFFAGKWLNVHIWDNRSLLTQRSFPVDCLECLRPNQAHSRPPLRSDHPLEERNPDWARLASKQPWHRARDYEASGRN